MTGTVLGARYELLEQFDAGGMADIYKAFCRKTKTIVAVKVLKECFSDNAEYIDRFKREAEAVFSLDHPNIVHVTDIGCEEGVYYMVMEYIEGSTLKSIIDQRSIDEREAVGYAIQVCSALAAAHKKGIIHRDIKPHNILIDKDGNVKLTDFGIAKSISTKEERANQVIGSVHYISPEQAKGERVDTRTDIYSLGIVLYEMLTGVLPHTGGKTVSVALKHINEQITPPTDLSSNISQSVNYIVLKATNKNKRDRYQSMDDLKSDLVLSLADPGGAYLDIPLSYRNTIKTPASTKKRNMYWKVGMLFLLVAVIASLVVVGFIVFNPSSVQTFIVPDFVGSTIDTAEKNLANMSVNTTYEPSESAGEGTIISQSPEAGSRAANGAAINLTISNGPAASVMPDLSGMTLEEARAQLKTMGLEIDNDFISYDFKQDVPPGVVISQMPEPDAPLTGSDIISITISSENIESNVMMPSLSGKLVNEAVSFLRDSGFSNCFVYEEDSPETEGTVISQSPEEGIQTPYTDVFITISKYKSQKYQGKFSVNIEITEKESKVKVVLQEIMNGETINFIEKETAADEGRLPLSLDLYSISSGTKNVIVYVNGQETYSREVEFR